MLSCINKPNILIKETHIYDIEMSSMYTTLVALDHWTVREAVDNPTQIVYNMHDILNEDTRALNPALQDMYDRLMVLFMSVRNAPVEGRRFTWQNVRAVLGDGANAVIMPQLAGDCWSENQCAIAGLIVYGEWC